MFSQARVELGQSREVGDRLLVLGQMTAVGRASGAEVSGEVGWVASREARSSSAAGPTPAMRRVSAPRRRRSSCS